MKHEYYICNRRNKLKLDPPLKYHDSMIALSTTQGKLSYLATNHIENYMQK
jgi:hypothetical protein